VAGILAAFLKPKRTMKPTKPTKRPRKLSAVERRRTVAAEIEADPIRLTSRILTGSHANNLPQDSWPKVEAVTPQAVAAIAAALLRPLDDPTPENAARAAVRLLWASAAAIHEEREERTAAESDAAEEAARATRRREILGFMPATLPDPCPLDAFLAKLDLSPLTLPALSGKGRKREVRGRNLFLEFLAASMDAPGTPAARKDAAARLTQLEAGGLNAFEIEPLAILFIRWRRARALANIPNRGNLKTTPQPRRRAR
jgi:hypothetical protein